MLLKNSTGLLAGSQLMTANAQTTHNQHHNQGFGDEATASQLANTRGGGDLLAC
jgi:hypothetical protein